MTARVYALTETTDRTGFTLGVFAERVLAIEAALSNAEHRIARCIAADEKTFGRPVPEGTYVTSLVEADEHAKVVIVHRPSGEEDSAAWQIWPFDVVERPGLSNAVQHDLFCGVGRAP